MKISNREIIIAAVAILVLLGIGYVINNNSSDNSEEQKQEDQVDLNGKEDENTDENKDEEVKEAVGVVSANPKSSSELSLADAPKSIVIVFDKEMAAGSEIKVVSDKNIDVVTGGNRITTDLKQLSAPVSITAAGVYSVSYSINYKDGKKSDGGYKFTIK